MPGLYVEGRAEKVQEVGGTDAQGDRAQSDQLTINGRGNVMVVPRHTSKCLAPALVIVIVLGGFGGEHRGRNAGWHLIYGSAVCLGAPGGDADSELSALESAPANWLGINDNDLGRIVNGKHPKRLDLSSAYRITDAGLANLEKLTDLEELRLGGLLFTDEGLSHLKELKNLKVVALTSDHVTGKGLSYLHESKGLQSLALDGNSFNDAGLENLKNWPGLRELELNLSSNGKGSASGVERRAVQVSERGLIVLKYLSNLRLLHLACLTVSDAGFETLRGLKKLETLEIDQVDINEPALASIGSLTGLCTLRMFSAPIKGGGFAHLRTLQNLQELSLENNGISENDIQELGAIVNLRRLGLMNQYNLGGRGMASVLRELKQLEELDLEGSSGLGNSPLVGVSALTHLRRLHLGTTGVSFDGLRSIEKLTQLEDLDLYMSGTTDDGMAYLKNLKELRVLDLGETDVTDAGLAKLKELTKLRSLGFQGLNVSDRGIEQLASLPNVQSIDLDGTKVSKKGLAQLYRAWPGLREVEYGGGIWRYPDPFPW